MRSLFSNRPAWAVQVESAHTPLTTTGAEEEEDPFSRSKEAYAREERAKALAKEEELKRKGKGKAKDTSHLRDVTADSGPIPKRRRVSQEDVEDVKDEDVAQRNVVRQRSPARSHTPLSPLKQMKERFQMLSQSPSSHSTPRRVDDEPIVIDMSDDEDSTPLPPQHSPPRPASHAPESPLKSFSAKTVEYPPLRKKTPQTPDIDNRTDSHKRNENTIILDDDDIYTTDHPTKPNPPLSPTKTHTTTHTIYPDDPTTTTHILSSPPPLPLKSPPKPPQPAPALPDPILHLLIHSPQFPQTRPLIIKIRLSTRLKAVREAWINYQSTPISQHSQRSSRPPPSSDATVTPSPQKPHGAGASGGGAEGGPILPDHVKSEIFLTFRRRRVFDFTTCRSLGLNVNAHGEVVLGGKIGAALGGEVFDGDEDGAQVTMEAVTGKWLEVEAERKRRGEDARARGGASVFTGGSSGGGAGGGTGTTGRNGDGSTSQEKSNDKGEQIRVIIKAKGLEDYKLRVRASTKIVQILRIFRKYRCTSVPAEKTLVLMFEGERLEEESEVQDAEITDLDVLEVYVR